MGPDRRVGFALVALCIVAAGCTSRTAPEVQVAFDGTLPAIAAQYHTEVFEGSRQLHATDWRLWRQENRIERENLQAGTGELWQRDGATLFHSQLYHAHQRGIEYQPGDLGMIGASPQWVQQAWIVSPELIRNLRVQSTRERDGVIYQRYEGSYAGAEWDVLLRLDQMLPQSVERRHGERIERIELREVHPIDQAPWQPTPSRDYEMIDFADIGDRERDPFVLALQAAGHAHAHQH